MSDTPKHDPKEVLIMLNDPDSVGRALPLCIAAECIEQLQKELSARPEVVQVVDLDQDHWKQIKEAAKQSPWITDDYMQNDWVADVCAYLLGNP